MKKLTVTIFLSASFLIAAAQDKKIEITSERQNDKSVSLSYTKNDPGSYTVVLKFLELTNADHPLEVHTITGTAGPLLSLKPKDKERNIGYRYSYRYIRGKLNPKVNKDFCYVLPYSAGKTCTIAEAGYANERYFGAEKPADWKSYFFYTKNEETVMAVRKGVVVEIVDEFDLEKNVEFTTKKNSIMVEHEDGSLIIYKGFKKGSLKVKAGDVVFPHSPLGLNSSFSGNGFGISIFIYYLNSVDFERLQGQTLSSPRSLYAIVAPQFITGEGACAALENRKAYTSFSDEGIISKEMSKRELKKYKRK